MTKTKLLEYLYKYYSSGYTLLFHLTLALTGYVHTLWFFFAIYMITGLILFIASGKKV